MYDAGYFQGYLDKLEWEIALTGYVVPGCAEDGTWMLWKRIHRCHRQMGFLKVVAILHTFAHRSILCVCRKWGHNKRWRAVRRMERIGISIRVCLFFGYTAKSSKDNQKRSDVFEHTVKHVQFVWKPWYSQFVQTIRFVVVCPNIIFRGFGTISHQFRTKIM